MLHRHVQGVCWGGQEIVGFSDYETVTINTRKAFRQQFLTVTNSRIAWGRFTKFLLPEAPPPDQF